jgi:hypothetical protein
LGDVDSHLYDGNYSMSCPAYIGFVEAVTFRAFAGRPISCICSVGCGTPSALPGAWDFMSDELVSAAAEVPTDSFVSVADAQWLAFKNLVTASHPSIKLRRLQGTFDPLIEKTTDSIRKSLRKSAEKGMSKLIKVLEKSAKECADKPTDDAQHSPTVDRHSNCCKSGCL